MIILTKDGLVITGETIYVDPQLAKDKKAWSWKKLADVKIIMRCKVVPDEKAVGRARACMAAFLEHDKNYQFRDTKPLVSQNKMIEIAG